MVLSLVTQFDKQIVIKLQNIVVYFLREFDYIFVKLSNDDLIKTQDIDLHSYFTLSYNNSRRGYGFLV